MDENLGGLSIPIGADPSGLRRGLDEAARAVDDAARRINNSANSIVTSLDKINKAGEDLSRLGTRLSTYLTLPILGLATASVKAYADIQSLQKGLESITGSASVANREFEKLKEVAKLPGIGLQEAVKGSINLQAIGYSAKSAREILMQFGNAVASVGKGRVEFERAIYGVTQLANTSFPLGEDLNIIADALPQVRTLLNEAFGKTRSDDLAKMGVTSKQVMEVIVKGLGELPRVTGGIKNSFENLKDSLQQNLARIGKTIDSAFDISGTINKLTDFLDRLISRFENLSPSAQKTILVVAGIAASVGPLLVGLGGILTLVPLLVNGFNAIRTAVIATNTAMLANPYIAIAAALVALAGATAIYYASIETVTDRQNRLNDALARATVEARNEQAEVAKLYQKTQDQNLALDERNKAVDQLQKQYPAYFANLTNEAILAGNASQVYKQLTVDITNASRARAAQSELDKRNAKRLEEDLELQKKIDAVQKEIRNPKPVSITGGGGALGANLGQVIDEEEIVRRSRVLLGKLLDIQKQRIIDRNNEDKNLFTTIKQGQDAIAKLDDTGIDHLIQGTAKVKKERERQLAEIFPKGSLAELRQRADLLTKAIDTSVNDIVKIRGLDKFGKETNKQGLPYFTGEILSLEQARDRLEELKIQIGEIEIQPIKLTGKGLLDQFGNEFKSVNDLLAYESARTFQILNTVLPNAFLNGGTKIADAIKAAKLEEIFLKANENIRNIIQDSTISGVENLFTSLGEALANGGNAIQAIGQSILATLGNFISKFGIELVKTALLSEVFGGLIIAIKNAFGNPYVLLALGAAAIAVGAAVTASAKRTSSTASSGGSFSSSAGTTGNNYSASYMSGGNLGGQNRIELFVDGRNLVRVLNNNLSEQDRLNAG